MNWQARLEFLPIVTPDGEILTTLADARSYLLKHPNEDVAGAVLYAAEHPSQLPLHIARQMLSRAVHGPERRPEPVRKEAWRERRKARRSGGA
jgi:hypothetical protein